MTLGQVYLHDSQPLSTFEINIRADVVLKDVLLISLGHLGYNLLSQWIIAGSFVDIV